METPQERLPPTILVVDDEPMIRRTVARVLRRNYQIVEANDGVEAQEILRAQKVDLVITDLRMPRLDGLGLLAWARETCPGPAWLVLSGVDTFAAAVKALQLGAFDFVTKPLASLDALETSVRNALTQRRLEVEKEQLRRELEASNVALRGRVEELVRAYGLLREQADVIDQDLRRAERIQIALLPQAEPQIAGFSVEALYRPSHLVGGDTYDVLHVDDRHVALYVADSAGHGVSAAMLSMLVRLRVAPTTGTAPRAPADVLATLNRDLFAECSASGLFVSAAYVLLDTQQRTAVFASAGHPPLLHVHADGGKTVHERTGPALGLAPDATYGERMIELRGGDQLLFYTDGLLWGHADPSSIEDRLARAMSDGNGAGALTRALEEVSRDRKGERSADDVTMVLLRAAPSPSRLDHATERPPGAPVDQAVAAVTVGESGDATWIAVSGTGTWTQCAALHDVCTEALAAQRALVVDLRACIQLDSTFLGTLHHVASEAGPAAARLRLVAVPEEVRKLFRELAMDLVASRVIEGPAPPPPSQMRPLCGTHSMRPQEIILQAHELLVSLSAQNAEQFGDVVTALRSEPPHA